ncbi:MAG: hypothetical protein MUO72_12955 [Bacteroidales bacterium]|nr:hypothetical protein [Bacteroidales bacterium]
MIREVFTYEDFVKTREDLITCIRNILTEDDKRFIISFKSGSPDWSLDSFNDFKNYPAIKWKLQNINYLRAYSPKKHQQQLENLKQELKLKSNAHRYQ